VVDYLKANQEIDRFDLIRGIASGLHYLHSQKPNAVIHGDLKGRNIVVDDSGNPKLCDFGLSSIANATEMSTTFAAHGSAAWMAPERHDPNSYGLTRRQAHTPASDVFSFGMTVYEIVSERDPYDNPYDAHSSIVAGKWPNVPAGWRVGGPANAVVRVMRSCWVLQPSERPSSAQIVHDLVRPPPLEISGPPLLFPGPAPQRSSTLPLPAVPDPWGVKPPLEDYPDTPYRERGFPSNIGIPEAIRHVNAKKL